MSASPSDQPGARYGLPAPRHRHRSSRRVTPADGAPGPTDPVPDGAPGPTDPGQLTAAAVPTPGAQVPDAGRRATASALPGSRLLSWARPWTVQILGWLLAALACYPTLWDKTGQPRFKLDAWIYQHAIAQWHAGGSLYDWYANPDQHLWPFTYTPFAAWVLTPLTWIPDRANQVVMVLATPVCVAVTAWAVARCLGAERREALALAPWAVLAGVAVVEPVYKSMEYGQVNAQLMMLVALDLLVVPASSRWRGVLSGLAAAFKLTPAIAVLVLLARREWRAAATMTGTAAGVTALAWVVSPRESLQFFTSAMWDPARAGFADYAGNQNLKGLVARALPEAAWTPAWAACVVVCVLAAWLLLTRLERWQAGTVAHLPAGADGTASTDAAHLPAGAPARPAEAAGTTDVLTSTPHAAREDPLTTGAGTGTTVLLLEVSVVMVLGLLVSPISWSHHWVWVLVAVPALAGAGWRWHAPALTACAVAGLAVFALAMQWWFPEQNHIEQTWPAWARVVGSSYTLWALVSGIVLGRVVVTGGSARVRGVES